MDLVLQHLKNLCACFSVSKIKVKETHCTVSDLVPNAQYELWVTATNTTGISPASEKALYMTGRWAHSHVHKSHHSTYLILLPERPFPLGLVYVCVITLCFQILTGGDAFLASAFSSGDQAEGVQQLSRSCSDSLGIRKHQPRRLLHCGAQWDASWWPAERHYWVRTAT